jgi:hypothetical protein
MLNKVVDKNCITPSIGGGLGNNMFMIAHAYAEAIEQNKQLVIPKKQLGHMDDYKNNIFRKLDFYIDSPDEIINGVSTLYSGYFQSEKYFEKYTEAIKQLFSPTREFIEYAFKKYPFLNEPTKNIAISIRRGDYLIYTDYHPVVTKEYVDAALKKIPEASSNYIVFSDDLKWCRENLQYSPIYFIEAPFYEQLWLMSLCDNFVISNSSFSWWGAYLSRNKDKIVIAPETWLGPKGPANYNDIYCKNWVVLPTYFKDGYIFPKQA